MRRARMFACLTLAALILASAAVAEDFRIQTRVFSGKEKEPVSQATTLFRAGAVYDYLESAPGVADRVAVFDKAHGRFILLDVERKVKSEVKTDDVLLFTTKLQAAVNARSKHPFTKFAAAPDFKVELAQDGELTLASDFMTYTLATMPANSPEAATQYREFSDWYARFNTMAHPGSTPPFARMAVNAELAKRGLVPTEVHLSIPAQTEIKAAELRSEHHITWRLLPKDDDRIDKTANQLAAFKLVDFDQFERPDTAKK